MVRGCTGDYSAAAVALPPLHVLFVARWYPSHDQLGRGSFVADLARALTAFNKRIRQQNFIEVMMPVWNCIASDKSHFLLVGATESALVDLPVTAQSQPVRLVCKQSLAGLRPARMGNE